MIDGYDWTIQDTFAAQNMCPYETVRHRPWLNSLSFRLLLTAGQVAYGFSRFCDLFTYEEWNGFSYAIDLAFAGNNAFQNPCGVCLAPSSHLAIQMLMEVFAARGWHRIPTRSYRPTQEPYARLQWLANQRDTRQ
jgi:ribosome modulation factor